MRREPAILIGSIVTALIAIVDVLVAFGLPITDGQKVIVIACINALATAGGAIWTRAQVVAPATHEAALTASAVNRAGATTVIAVSDGSAIPVEVEPAPPPGHPFDG